MCDTNYSHCEHMCLCYIMLWIHFLNISSQGRRKSRWNRWIAEQNPGGVKAGALYGRENTCKVNQYNLFIWQPHFIKFGINVPFKPSWIVLWRAVSVLSVTVYACKCIWTQKYLTSTNLKIINTLKTSDCTDTQKWFKSKQNSTSWHCDNSVFKNVWMSHGYLRRHSSFNWDFLLKNITILIFPKVWR